MVPEHLPRFVPPMLARSASPTDAGAWAYEVKFDGMRAQVRLDRRELCLRSRPGRDCTEAFPELAPLAALRRRRLLLDGELVCLNDEGDPDFARLRARLRSAAREARFAAERSPATFLAFDVLHLDGRSTRALSYAERRALLAELALDGPGWLTPRAFAADEGPALLEATRERGLEGVVMKRLDAPYLPGVRSAAWVKHKHRRSENLVVTGWVPASGTRPEALLVARVGVDGSLAPAGSVSLGYHGEVRERIQEALRASELPPVRPCQRLRRVKPFSTRDSRLPRFGRRSAARSRAARGRTNRLAAGVRCLRQPSACASAAAEPDRLTSDLHFGRQQVATIFRSSVRSARMTVSRQARFTCTHQREYRHHAARRGGFQDSGPWSPFERFDEALTAAHIAARRERRRNRNR